MREPSLKAGIWINAQIRQCDIDFMPAVIVRKGDPDAGSVLLILDRFEAGSDLYTQARTAEGERAWVKAAGGKTIDRQAAAEFIERQVKRDPDLWVLEIEDPDHRYQLDGPVL